MGCNNKKKDCNDRLSRNCGKKHPATCIDYEGDLHENTNLDECDCHTLEDVIEDINDELDDINKQIDLSELGDSCFNFETDDEGRIVVKEVLLKFEEAICDLQDATSTEDESGCPSIFTEDISCLNLDFGCLTDPCGGQITNLKDLLQALINQVCTHTHE